MDNTLEELYKVILNRRSENRERSYTAYLFEKGLDKILKKIGEESTEVVIASKNMQGASEDDIVCRNELTNEICDLLYHLLVLMAEQNISVEEIYAILENRMLKPGNLKEQKDINKNT